MTIKELKEKLEKFPDHCEVMTDRIVVKVGPSPEHVEKIFAERPDSGRGVSYHYVEVNLE